MRLRHFMLPRIASLPPALRRVAAVSAAGLVMAAAAPPPGDPAAALRGPLTPMGAERAGNADGTIPAWTGAVTPADPAGSETPILVIDHANFARYEARLPE